MTDTTDSSPVEPSIRVLSTGLSPEEVAAVTAVIEAAVEEELDALNDQTPAAPSAWERSQRVLREPQHPGPGVWRSFSG